MQPSLAELQQALSCNICYELLSGPVSLPCGHSFCSSCIRSNADFKTSTGQRPSCPECRAGFETSDLRANISLRQAATVFSALHQNLQALYPALSKPNGRAAHNGHDPKGLESGQADHVNESKRQRVEHGVLDNDTRSFCPALNASHSIEGNGQYPNSARKEDVRPFDSGQRQAADQRQPARPARPPLQPPPKLCFQLMKDSQLKTKMQSLGLPVTGKRQEWIERYMNYRRYIESLNDKGENLTSGQALRKFLAEDRKLQSARNADPQLRSIDMGLTAPNGSSNSFSALISATAVRSGKSFPCAQETGTEGFVPAPNPSTEYLLIVSDSDCDGQ